MLFLVISSWLARQEDFLRVLNDLQIWGEELEDNLSINCAICYVEFASLKIVLVFIGSDSTNMEDLIVFLKVVYRTTESCCWEHLTLKCKLW